jgi:hypothetical protein
MAEKQKMVLTVPNRHAEGCGEPPGLVAENHYIAYFENQFGEQLVFTYDRVKKEGKLLHGDCGWDTPIEVFAGGAFGVTLSEEEKAWLKLVWAAATKQPVSTEFVEGSGNGHEGYYNIKGFTDWGIKVPLRVPREQVIRMLAALMSINLGMSGVDTTLRKWRGRIEQTLAEAGIDEADHEIK